MQQHSKFFIVLLLTLLIIGLSHYDRARHSLDGSAIISDYVPKHAAPDVTFTLMSGKKLPLHSLAGHRILLHFWASWCAPCREEFPGLLACMQNDKNDTILLTVSGDANAEDARKFLTPFMHDFPQLFKSGKVLAAADPQLKLIADIFQTFQFPETIVVNPDFILQKKIVGIYRE